MNEHSSGVCSSRRKHIHLNSTWDLKTKGLNSCVRMSPLSLTRELVNRCIWSPFPATVVIVGPTRHCLSLQSMCLSPHLPKRLQQPCCCALAFRRLFQSVTDFYFIDKSKPEVFISQSREGLSSQITDAPFCPPSRPPSFPLLGRLCVGIAHLRWQKCSYSLTSWVVKQPKPEDCND